jgi:hypothetical protein
MPVFTGQTNQLLRIPLPSAILSARWLSEAAALGGTVWAEVRTRFVADDSEIEIKVADALGNSLGTYTGKMIAQSAQIRISLDQDNETGRMFFEARLPDQGLRQASGPLTVCPPIQLKPRFLDKDGSPLSVCGKGVKIRLVAEAIGAAEGMSGELILWLKSRLGRRQLLTKTLKVKDGKLTLLWNCSLPQEGNNPVQTELDPGAEKYEDLVLVLEARCLGYKAEADSLPYETLIDFTFGPAGDDVESREVDFTLPDGGVLTKSVPRDGVVSIAKPKTGEVRVKDFRITLLEQEVKDDKTGAALKAKSTPRSAIDSDATQCWSIQLAGLPYGKTREQTLVVLDEGGKEVGRKPLSKGKRTGAWTEFEFLLPPGSQVATLKILDAESRECQTLRA